MNAYVRITRKQNATLLEL